MRLGVFVLLAALAAPSFAAIEGTVINKTTGKPQAGVTVNVLKMGQGGMQSGGSATSAADGKFKLESDANAMHLLQATWQGVTYNVQLQPGAATTGIEVPVYDVLAKVSAAEVTQHMILVEKDAQELVVNETVIYSNDSQTTWNDPKAGTFRFSVPPEAGANVQARAIAPGGMPVEREAKKAGEKGVYYLDFPVKPGETRFDVSYKMPAKESVVLAGKVLHEGQVQLVVPQGIKAEGQGLAALGVEPKTQASIFGIKGSEYKVMLTGSGSMRATEAAAPAPTQREEDAPRIQQILPPGYERQWKWVLGLILAILGLSFCAQYVKPLPSPGGKPKA